jgi:protein SMG8
MSELLREVPGIGKDWVHHMRPCTPRLLFLFETCPRLVMKSTLDDIAKELPENHKLSIKKMEHSIEDHIYRIFRRMRIVTNIR